MMPRSYNIKNMKMRTHGAANRREPLRKQIMAATGLAKRIPGLSLACQIKVHYGNWFHNQAPVFYAM
jgi:hypothetical protein